MPRLVMVDAFADRPFAGNPAVVVVLTEPAEPAWMQAVATEMNQPATAFPQVSEGPTVPLRWFSPLTELEFCGHGTFSAAHVLWDLGLALADQPLTFATQAGELVAARDGEWIRVDFPAVPVAPVEAPKTLAAALGLASEDIVAVGRNELDWLIEVPGPKIVRGLAPHLDGLRALPGRGFIVTSRSDEDGQDFISRFFAPSRGNDEDHVTGSAHCALAPYWAERLGRDHLVGYQASARGGTMRVETNGARVTLSGKVTTIATGDLRA